jgi:hypothetical protein
MGLPALAVLLSAFLLFLVQPLIGRLVLPWFGGSAAVWTACLVFFQTGLVLGYGYAALSIRLFSPANQRRLHVTLLGASLLALPLLPDAAWKPADGDDALLRLAGLLLATAGAPYLLLAATGPLVQSWLAATGRPPWRLFAVSNAASIGALAAYPVAIEPWFTLRLQATLWSAFYLLAALLVTLLAWRTRDAAPVPVVAATPPPAASQVAAWMVLAAVPTALLVATTEHLTRDVAPVPLLWIPPLALYLLSFVVWFDGRLPFHRLAWILAAAAAVLLMGRAMTLVRYAYQPLVLVPLFAGGLVVVCLYCHGELARRRPDARRLGAFYFSLALGGALGGLSVAIAAPAILSRHLDLAIVLAATALPLTIGALSLDRLTAKSIGLACAVAALAGGGYGLRHLLLFEGDRLVSVQRNFYGTLKVEEEGIGTPDHRRELMHGTILHGAQYQAPERRRETTEYYRSESAVGRAVATLPERPRRIAVVGLGPGTVAAYGRPGDLVVFYEIDPAMIAVARRDFSFLADSPATIEIVAGDARLSLEREAPRHYDLLVLDAFAGNAPPLHLLTVEAFALYIRHMAAGGVIAVQVSNKFLELDPLVVAALQTHGWTGELATDGIISEWVVAAHERGRLARPPLGGALSMVDTRGVRPWTDDFIDLLRALPR